MLCIYFTKSTKSNFYNIPNGLCFSQYPMAVVFHVKLTAKYMYVFRVTYKRCTAVSIELKLSTDLNFRNEKKRPQKLFLLCIFLFVKQIFVFQITVLYFIERQPTLRPCVYTLFVSPFRTKLYGGDSIFLYYIMLKDK